MHPPSRRCPEGIEPSASGVEVRRSCPAELQARQSVHRFAQPAGAPRGAEKTHGTGSRVRQRRRCSPRRVSTRTALFLDPEPELSNRSCAQRKRRPASPVCIGEAGRLAAGACAGRGRKALRRSTSHGVSENPTTEPQIAARIPRTLFRAPPRGGQRIGGTRQRHASLDPRGRLLSPSGGKGMDVHRGALFRSGRSPEGRKTKKEPRSSRLLAKTRRAPDLSVCKGLP